MTHSNVSGALLVRRMGRALAKPIMQGGSVHYIAQSSLTGSARKQRQNALEKLADDALQLRNELSKAITDVSIFFANDD